jgi:hypothetical protein
MTPLRAKMIMDMQLHRLAPGTQALYLREVASLATSGVKVGRFCVR